MIEVRVPKMGMSTVECDVATVVVSVGDRIVAGQVLAEVEAEKASVEIEAEQGGVVAEVLAEARQVVQVGDVLFRIRED